jgi:restriction system protein
LSPPFSKGEAKEGVLEGAKGGRKSPSCLSLRTRDANTRKGSFRGGEARRNPSPVPLYERGTPIPGKGVLEGLRPSFFISPSPWQGEGDQGDGVRIIFKTNIDISYYTICIKNTIYASPTQIYYQITSFSGRSEMAIESFIKGKIGEIKTNLAQILFLDLKEYHIFNNVLLKANHGTTQIDHIIVSKYGIFVIETKNWNGWIYGKRDDDYWTHVFFKAKHKLQNPLHQNYLHTKSLAEVLKINHNLMFPVVKFWGKCSFKTSMPEGVLKSGLTRYIKNKKSVLLHEHEVMRVCQELTNIKDNTSIFDNGRHIRSLKKRFNG